MPRTTATNQRIMPITADHRPPPPAVVTLIHDGHVTQWSPDKGKEYAVVDALRMLAEDQGITDIYVSLQWYEGGRLAWQWELRDGVTVREPYLGTAV